MRILVNFKLIVISITIILSSSYESFSQSQNGGYSSAYLNRNTSARINGMAGAYTAVINDPNAVFINPAGVGFLLDKPMFVTSVSVPAIGRLHSNLAYGQGLGENFGIGIGLNSFTSGSFTARDVMGNPLGDRRDWQYSANVSGAYATQDFGFGATFKYLGHQLTGDDVSASGFAFDLGTKFNVMNLFSFGASIQNLGAKMKWNTLANTEDIVPVVLKAGVAFEFGLNEESVERRTSVTGEVDTLIIPATNYLMVSFDAHYRETDIAPNFILGLELVPTQVIAIRGGVNLYGEDEGKPTLLPVNIWGAGISLRPEINSETYGLNFDYSITNEYILGSGVAHHISIVINLM